jgi:hypothetical protein
MEWEIMIDYVQCIKNISHQEVEGCVHLDWIYSPESIDQILSKTVREDAGPGRYFQNRSLFYAKGRYWQFFYEDNYLKYSSSIDGITWSDTPESIYPMDYYPDFSVKLINDKIYLIVGNYDWIDTHYEANHYFWMGEPNTDGTITWITIQIKIPPPTGTWSQIFGNPNMELDTSGIPFISYQILNWVGNDLRVCVRKSNGTMGASWGAPSLDISTPEHDVTSSSLVRLSGGRMMLIYNIGNSVYSRLWSGSSWNSKEMNIYPYQYHAVSAIQSVSDNCQNIYTVWQWKDDSDEFGYPNTLRLHVYNLVTDTWYTQILVSGLTEPVYPTICKRTDKSDFHIYYATGANIYRISILNCSPIGVGEILSPVLVATETSNVSSLQTQDFITLEEDKVCSIGLTYNIGGTIKFMKDVLPYTKNNSEAVEIYRKKQGDIYFIKIKEIEYGNTDFTDIESLDTGTYIYSLRVRDVEGNYSRFSYITIYHTKVGPQIEFAGRGGFNSVRHAIYTFHSEMDADNSLLTIKLWDTSNTDASEEPIPPFSDMKLHGSKEIEAKDIEPFTTDTFISGSELKTWKRIYSSKSKTDKNTSARIRLKGGR